MMTEKKLTRDEVDKLAKTLYKAYAKQKPFIMEGYEIQKVRLSNEQVMNDIDPDTSHGVLRLVYTVRHKLIKEMK